MAFAGVFSFTERQTVNTAVRDDNNGPGIPFAVVLWRRALNTNRAAAVHFAATHIGIVQTNVFSGARYRVDSRVYACFMVFGCYLLDVFGPQMTTAISANVSARARSLLKGRSRGRLTGNGSGGFRVVFGKQKSQKQRSRMLPNKPRR